MGYNEKFEEFLEVFPIFKGRMPKYIIQIIHHFKDLKKNAVIAPLQAS